MKSYRCVEFSVAGITVRLADSVVSVLPEAPLFVRWLAAKGKISLTSCVEYARRVANAKREGRWRTPKLSAYNIEATALRAYWRWIAQTYEERTRTAVGVLRAHQHDITERVLHRLRVGCLVPPYPGKVVYAADPTNPPAFVSWQPCTTWTLHVPGPNDSNDYRVMPETVPPNYTMVVYRLSQVEIEAIAESFYAAWGKEAVISEMPGAAPLFGEPPLAEDAEPLTVSKDERMTAFVERGTAAEQWVTYLRGSSTDTVKTFVDRMRAQMPRFILLDHRALAQLTQDEFDQIVEQIKLSMRPLDRRDVVRLAAGTETATESGDTNDHSVS